MGCPGADGARYSEAMAELEVQEQALREELLEELRQQHMAAAAAEAARSAGEQQGGRGDGKGPQSTLGQAFAPAGGGDPKSTSSGFGSDGVSPAASPGFGPWESTPIANTDSIIANSDSVIANTDSFSANSDRIPDAREYSGGVGGGSPGTSPGIGGNSASAAGSDWGKASSESKDGSRGGDTSSSGSGGATAGAGSGAKPPTAPPSTIPLSAHEQRAWDSGKTGGVAWSRVDPESGPMFLASGTVTSGSQPLSASPVQPTAAPPAHNAGAPANDVRPSGAWSKLDQGRTENLGGEYGKVTKEPIPYHQAHHQLATKATGEAVSGALAASGLGLSESASKELAGSVKEVLSSVFMLNVPKSKVEEFQRENPGRQGNHHQQTPSHGSFGNREVMVPYQAKQTEMMLNGQGGLAWIRDNAKIREIALSDRAPSASPNWNDRRLYDLGIAQSEKALVGINGRLEATISTFLVDQGYSQADAWKLAGEAVSKLSIDPSTWPPEQRMQFNERQRVYQAWEDRMTQYRLLPDRSEVSPEHNSLLQEITDLERKLSDLYDDHFRVPS